MYSKCPRTSSSLFEHGTNKTEEDDMIGYLAKSLNELQINAMCCANIGNSGLLCKSMSWSTKYTSYKKLGNVDPLTTQYLGCVFLLLFSYLEKREILKNIEHRTRVSLLPTDFLSKTYRSCTYSCLASNIENAHKYSLKFFIFVQFRPPKC